MQHAEDARQLRQQISTLLKEMELAVANGQWQRIRALDKRMVKLLNVCNTPELQGLQQQLQPIIARQYRQLLGKIDTAKSELESKMRQHVSDKEGLEAYQASVDGRLW
ncbi:MAG: hypothetical protein LRY40_07625 [Shewanella fodinae]|uniref:hypothetical protein n=1 Tax=Shewanella fodinae TaxID=552357 RepID=UPI001678DF2F|nr:hypothetical protein [Shewanella fodinae]MCD8476211.1 hypothetical protein [Shewanella fodinae]MCL2908013.1 hypothetical protein [Shewanella fodinae]GGZ12697.1 hypothetical protein GCM10007169_31740 [Shewanella fodinae]